MAYIITVIELKFPLLVVTITEEVEPMIHLFVKLLNDTRGDNGGIGFFTIKTGTRRLSPEPERHDRKHLH